MDDEFERAANESTNGGGSNNAGGPVNTGGNQYMKQKDFIIKKMFKVPSNE